MEGGLGAEVESSCEGENLRLQEGTLQDDMRIEVVEPQVYEGDTVMTTASDMETHVTMQMVEPETTTGSKTEERGGGSGTQFDQNGRSDYPTQEGEESSRISERGHMVDLVGRHQPILPQEMVEHILKRVRPRSSLNPFRSVSSAWLKSIESIAGKPVVVYHSQLERCMYLHSLRTFTWVKEELPQVLVVPSGEVQLIAASGGLVCFSKRLRTLVVYNPLTKRWRELELPESILPGWSLPSHGSTTGLVGLSLNQNSGIYHIVIASFSDGPGQSACYNSATGVWEQAGAVPPVCRSAGHWAISGRAVSCSGNLYWVAQQSMMIFVERIQTHFTLIKFEVQSHIWRVVHTPLLEEPIREHYHADPFNLHFVLRLFAAQTQQLFGRTTYSLSGSSGPDPLVLDGFTLLAQSGEVLLVEFQNLDVEADVLKLIGPGVTSLKEYLGDELISVVISPGVPVKIVGCENAFYVLDNSRDVWRVREFNFETREFIWLQILDFPVEHPDELCAFNPSFLAKV